MLNRLKIHWPHVLLTLVLLAALSPTPIAKNMVIALRSAAVAIEGNRPELALESLESAIDFEPALGALHLPAAEIALAAGAPEKTLVHLEVAARLNLPDTIQICLHNRAHLALGNISEAVWGILWYLGLLVPFAFFFEKLVFFD